MNDSLSQTQLKALETDAQDENNGSDDGSGLTGMTKEEERRAFVFSILSLSRLATTQDKDILIIQTS